MKSCTILSTGSHLPETVIYNSDLEQFPASALGMIAEKTGVVSRRVAAPGQCTSDLALEAARACLERVGFPPERLQGILLSTSSPDRIQPATATRVQHLLGAVNAFALDINSVCSGSVYGISLADALITSGKYENILLIASEMYSKILNRRDFSTYPFFGDGAGAILFQASDNGRGVLHSCLKTDGSCCDAVSVPAGGTKLPYEEVTNQRLAYFRMNGTAIFDFATSRGCETIAQLLDETGTELAQVDHFICHQANLNILKEIASRISVPAERFVVNLDRYGNTASASVLIGLDEAVSSRRIREGDLVMTVAFGGGLSWGGNLIRM